MSSKPQVARQFTVQERQVEILGQQVASLSQTTALQQAQIELGTQQVEQLLNIIEQKDKRIAELETPVNDVIGVPAEAPKKKIKK
jgi:hypothetical protein